MALDQEVARSALIPFCANRASGAGGFHEAFNLVQQLLGEAVSVEDLRVRLTSEEPGAFQTGAIVTGELQGSNPDNCPWYCYIYVLPFSARIP